MTARSIAKEIQSLEKEKGELEFRGKDIQDRKSKIEAALKKSKVKVGELDKRIEELGEQVSTGLKSLKLELDGVSAGDLAQELESI